MSITVAFLPVYANPYQHLLAGGLGAAGVEVRLLEQLPSAQWLRASRQSVQILHFHWLSGLYMSRFSTPLQVGRYLARLRLARRLGYRIVWTAHNIMPHKAQPRFVHAALRRQMMDRADAVIVHCGQARNDLLQKYPRSRPTYVVPLGTYAGVYPYRFGRKDSRKRLGLERGSFVYLFLGNIAPYKGLEQLVSAFQQQARPQGVVLIAGRNRDDALVGRLRALADGDERVRIVAETIPDEDMQMYLAAADVMVAPFTSVLTSSSVMVGMSYGLPVIVPALGCLPELVTPDAGILYDPAGSAGLASALHEILSLDLAVMSRAAADRAAEFDWASIGRQTAGIYRQALER